MKKRAVTPTTKQGARVVNEILDEHPLSQVDVRPAENVPPPADDPAAVSKQLKPGRVVATRHPKRSQPQTTPTHKRPPPDWVDERILTTHELLERVPLRRQTIWRMVREGRFPPPIRLTRARLGWRWSTVLRWLADREAQPIERRPYFGNDNEKSA